MTTKEEIKNIIRKTIGKTISLQKLQVLEPKEEEFGDYSTNIAFVLAKIKKQSSQDVAQKLTKEWQKSKLFTKVEIAGGGFVNFFLNQEYVQGKLKDIIAQGSNYGKVKQLHPLKIQVEFVSANPTGPLHLGHGRNAFYGDVLANVLSFAGHQVQREYYVNDAQRSTQIKELGKTALGKGSQYQSDYLKQKITAFQDELSKMTDEREAGHFIAQKISQDIKALLEKIGIKFDRWFSEETLFQNNAQEKLLQELGQRDLIYQKDGALWLKTAQFGDDKDRVVIRQSGESTYFLSDILYHQNKIQRGFNKIIDVWGADHQGHKKRMEALMKILGFKGDLDIPIIQMVRLKTKEGVQKMSKRSGTAVELEWLVNQVGKDVVRFMMLSKEISTQMIFDLEAAKEKSEKNPVYYVQYALVRCKSILEKSHLKTHNKNFQSNNLELLKEKEEIALIKELIKFPDLVKEIAQSYEVHRLITYGLSLAKKFHQFYKRCQVIDPHNEKLTQARLTLTKASIVVFENLFNLLGIEKLNKM